MDKDVLASLTDEERAAIEGGDTSPEEQAALQAIADADAGVVDNDDDDDDDAAAPAVVEPAAAAPVVAAAEIEPTASEAEPEFRPRYKAELPADYADQVAAVKTETDELAKSFKNGDIDFDEYQIQSAAIAERREALTIQRAKSEIAEEMGGQTAEQEWNNTINRFIAATAKAGDIDYSKDQAKLADLDQFVKVLANNTANDDKPGEWFLAEAHKRVAALHGLAAVKPTLADVPRRTKPVVPATSLAHVPGSEGAGDLAGEFADLDGLEGDALENAIAGMTKAQREKYSMVA